MSKRLRFFIVAALIALGAVFMYPTIQWYYLLDEPTKEIVSSSKEKIRDVSELKAQAIVETLVALVKAKPADLFPATEYGYVLDAAKVLYDKAKIPHPAVWTNKDVLSIFPPDVDEGTKQDLPSSTVLFEKVADQFRVKYLDLKNQKKSIVQLGLDLKGGISVVLHVDTSRFEAKLKADNEPFDDAAKKEAIDKATETLKSRVDNLGVADASIRSDINNMRITVDLPGDQDIERVNTLLLGGTALKLQLVNVEANDAFQSYLTQFKSANSGRNWTLADRESVTPGLIPAGSEIRRIVVKDKYGIDEVIGYSVVKEGIESVIEGSSIIKASPNRDADGSPITQFSMDADGAAKFQKLTAANVNKPLAIVLDGTLKGTPINIANEIPNGQVQITGFDYDESVDISKILRAGSLDVDLTVEGTNNVGASLGEDAIQSGIYAAMAGLLLVLVFMLVYYLGSGIVANIALVLNVLLLTAALSTIGFTLTLTSIAGLILTVGMAVDANVIIFERIKEELAIGKTRGAAIKAGYQKAFWAIMDGNITTLIASVLLASFGTGPIRGFAVTLTIGIITSMFTALFVTRLLQDFGTEQLGQTRMSISWRRK